MNPVTANIDNKLRDWYLSGDSQKGPLIQELYKIIFTNDLYSTLWDERVLLGLERLLDASPPNEEVFGEQVKALRERIHRVRAINDLFYVIVDPETPAAYGIETLAHFIPLSNLEQEQLHSSGFFLDLRKGSGSPSEKVQTLLQTMVDQRQAHAEPSLSELQSCGHALKEREESGAANALLIQKSANQGVLLPVSAKLQQGSGHVKIVTQTSGAFDAAVKRARETLAAKGFITQSQDVILSMELSEGAYSGGSIGLGAAMAIYASARKCHLDTYTAFTGDINLRGSEWVIQRVDGIAEKLQAAINGGCRRVFIPRDNELDIPTELGEQLRIIPVGDITEVLVRLLLPMGRIPGEGSDVRKINLLHAECIDRGWQLSTPRPIQGGLQFTVSPPTPPELKVSIYQTGSHSPKKHDAPQFQQILMALGELDSPQVLPRAVQQGFTVKDAQLRAQIQALLQDLAPISMEAKQYCEYALRFEEGKEKLVVTQYTSGKLQVQGFAGQLYKRILEAIVPSYNLHYPNALLDVEEFLTRTGTRSASSSAADTANTNVQEEAVSFPHIGTDESGKGDYFGPLVVAAVWLDELTQLKLENIGVRDSKALSDRRCRELASMIRELCRGNYEEVEILPERYNSLYEQFKNEGKNLNHLLAWGHARALESLLDRQESLHAIADQFGDEKYIRSKLMEKGKTVNLVQTPKAERYIAVAAASILARDRFLYRLQHLGQQVGTDLPKGASSAVVDAGRTIVDQFGPEAVRRVAKLHFKTTSLILAKR